MTKILASIIGGIMLLSVGGFVGWTNSSLASHTVKITDLEINDGMTGVRMLNMENQLKLIQIDIKVLLGLTARIDANSHKHSTEDSQ